MRYILFLIVLLCSMCSAQSNYPFTSPAKTITTTIDTINATRQYFQSYELIVINQTASTDTLFWWTDLDATKHALPPGYEDYRQHIVFSRLFRQSKGTSTAEAYGN
jgi:hypothetical protein